ncbi:MULTISPECIES: methylated-DNA--[protein]-cysteine S-methyltransferase [Marinospirillum]|uniref:Methylated-DNA-[protein]-cysteine S-methyltransferase DNA binding domain-containing protein n=1 Tax=Marinospirillum insulare TaxID=217169 RepID=A0ABQ6A1N0_9GAMM|nr:MULTISPECIES: methylated-DNA--[protein]-cysteine S-methyltransferase [Marinospirillum]GLR65293.1 hypothetical protein GCM10007878_27320 [Marinospirillum insulare]
MIKSSLLKGELQGWAEFQTGDCNAIILVSSKGLVALEPFFNDADFAEQLTAFSLAGIEPLSAGQRISWSQRLSAALVNSALIKDLPLDLRGTAFQLAVWSALLEIPKGKTLSYAQLAAALGKPKAVRAVGTACGANPIPFLVPCHRVLRSDGSLGGFAFGLTMKQQLLERENAL